MFHQPTSVSKRWSPSILLILFLAFGIIFIPSAAGLVNGPAEAAELASGPNPSAPDACTVVSSPQDLQSPTLINFDDIQHATVIGTYYQAAHGVVFGTGDSNVTAYEDPRAVSIYNLAVNEAMKPNNSAGKALKITFDKPVSQVGLFLGAGDGAKTNAILTAFDQLGVEICNVSVMPVPVGISQFLGLKNGTGAQIYSISLDYGDYIDPEIIDDFYFSRYENPVSCPITWVGFPASMNAGSTAGFTWSVTEKSYYSSQTYLVYDTVSHTVAESYLWYQSPTPNSGFGEFATNILAREAGNLFLRAGLTYQTTAGSAPQHCLSDYEVAVKVNPVAPTQTPPGGNVSGAVTTGKGTILTNVDVSVCQSAACQSSVSDKNGLYSIANLAPGDYALTAVLSGYDTFSSRVTIRSGQTTSANIGMRRIPTPTPPPVTGSVSGQVLDQSSSAAVAGASLELRAALGNSSTYMATTTADASGNFVFNGVPTGNWLVLASHRDYHSWFRAYSVAGSSTATGNISLRLRYRPPAPVPGAALDLSIANVMAFQASQRWDNSLQLAANRQTSLRGFVNLGSSNAADLRSPVEGYLYSSECLPAMGLLSSNVTPLPVSDWTTSNPERTAVLGNLGATLNFNLPLACTTPGTRHFTLILSPSTINLERNLDNNTHNFTVTFVERRPLLINFVRVSLV